MAGGERSSVCSAPLLTIRQEEMRNNLPKEMDFVHEANNAIKVAHDFQHISTSLYIPEVVVAKKRVLIMEYIQGGRVDDLAYLANNNIDRNKVALELSRIFSQMVFINGWFHAVSYPLPLVVSFLTKIQDPHPGNSYPSCTKVAS